MIATRKDADDLLRLLTVQLTEHHVDVDAGKLARAIDGVFADPSRGALFVVREGDRPIGVAYVSFNWSLEHAGRGMWLDELYVVEDRRNAGVGRALLEEVLEFGREQRVEAIDLEVEEDHARVESLYARHGFQRRTRRRWVLSMRDDRPREISSPG